MHRSPYPPQYTDGGLDLDAYRRRDGVIGHLRMPMDGARPSAEAMRCGQGRAPTLHRPRRAGGRGAVIWGFIRRWGGPASQPQLASRRRGV